MPYAKKEDLRAHGRRWRENNPERARATQKRYRLRNKEKIAAKNKAQLAKHPAREHANWKLRFAIHAGYITRPEGKIFHHPDYSRPYYGAWVTYTEHSRIHAGLIACPPCVDYSEQVSVAREASLKDGRSRGGSAACKVRWGTR